MDMKAIWTDNPLDEWSFEDEQAMLRGVCFKKGGGSQPAAPDPAATAAAQAAANKEAVYESARVNQINEESPFGNMSYTGEIGSPERTRTITLSPAEQQKIDQQNTLALTLGTLANDTAGTIRTTPGFNYDGIAQAPGIKDFSAERQRVEDAMYSRSSSRLDHRFGNARKSLENNLVNRGIARGTEAWDDALKDFTFAETDAYDQAANSAILAGGSEQSRMFGLGQAGRNQSIQERLLERTQPMNELAAVLQGSPAINAPQFGQQAQYQIAPGDIAGLTLGNYASQSQAANAANAASSSMWGSLIGAGATLGGSAILASDERLKTNIKRIGTHDTGIPVYQYQYIGEDAQNVGLLASDVEDVAPESVIVMDSGFKAIDYAEFI